MKYLLVTVLLSTTLVALWLSGIFEFGTQESVAAEPAGTREVTLNLKVPGSREFPDRKRGAKLLIDGKNYTPKLEIDGDFYGSKEVSLQVPVKADQKTVTIKYGFWTNNYTNIIRTKVLALDKGKNYTVDITKEDPKNRDHIEPIYVPTPNRVVEEMLKLAKVGKNDVVWDIGCGDGRMVIMAVEKFGAKKGLGIDIDPERIADSNANLKKSKVGDRVTFKVGNALELKDVSEATVVLLYMGDDLNLRLRPVLQQTLKPGARVVSHRFKMGDWKPDTTIKLKAKNNSGEEDDYQLHLWTIKESKKK